MSIPIEVKQLCDRYLELIQNHPQHHLSPNERYILYKSFGKSRIDLPEYKKSGQSLDVNEYRQFYKDRLEHLTLGDYALGWLSILTVKHILPIWDDKFAKQIREQEFGDENPVIPHQIVEAAEKVLNRTANLDEVFFDSNEDYHMGSVITDFVTYDLACIYAAASSTLGFVLYGDIGNSEMYENGDISYFFRDFASEAVKAYSVIDTNKPGAYVDRLLEASLLRIGTDGNIDPEIREVFGIDQPFDEDFLARIGQDAPEFKEWVAEQLEQKKIFKQLIFDPIKRLEFWEWWLSEAVPQAWEMAEQTYLH